MLGGLVGGWVLFFLRISPPKFSPEIDDFKGVFKISVFYFLRTKGDPREVRAPKRVQKQKIKDKSRALF